MTEYGKTLIEAGARASLVERFGVCASILFDLPAGVTRSESSIALRRTNEARSEIRAALLAFLDRLEEGPSGAMWLSGRSAFGTEAERYHQAPTDPLAQACADKSPAIIFAAMLKALRSEIAEESGR